MFSDFNIQEFSVNIISSFWTLTSEMAPYLLLGFVFAGILHIGVSQNYIKKHLGDNRLVSIVKAALFGIPLPLCSCGVIPTGISLHQNGAAKGPTVSFLISTPQTGVDSIMLTWSMLGLPFAIIRPIVALVSGVLGGAFTKVFDKDIIEIKKLNIEKEKTSNGSKLLKALKYGFIELPADIAKWLIVGLFLAAIIDVLVPSESVALIASNPVLEMLAILVIAVPLYVCATGSIPIAAVLLLKGLSPGAALVFLMAGPATNVATMTVIGKSMGKRTLFSYLFSITLGAIAFGTLINLFLPAEWFSILSSDHTHNHHEVAFFEQASAVVLLLTLVSSYIYVRARSKNKIDMKKDYTIFVEGMNCQHCQNSVRTNLEQLDGVEQVQVDLKSGEVTIEADDLDMELVEKKIVSLGFDVKK